MKSVLPGRGAAASMMYIACTARVFWGVAVDYTDAMNASWIAALAALVLILPLSFAVRQAAELSSASPWENMARGVPKIIANVFSALFIAVLIFDCAVNMRLLASTANIMALSDIPIAALMLPIALLIAYSVKCGASGVGYSARIYLLCMPLLLIVVFIVEFKAYRIGWLFPILGGGARAIANTAQVCAGWGALICLTSMVSLPDRKRHVLMRAILLAMITAAILLLALRMLYPSLTGAQITRATRADMIFSNGRVALSLQMILTILWYGSILYLLSAEAVTAACYVKIALPKSRPAITGLLLGAAALIFGVTLAGNQAVCRSFNRWLFIALGGIIALTMALGCIFRRGKACES